MTEQIGVVKEVPDDLFSKAENYQDVFRMIDEQGGLQGSTKFLSLFSQAKPGPALP